MKQIIFSVAIILTVLTTNAQNNLTHQYANSHVATWSLVKNQAYDNEKTSKPDSITMRVFRSTEGEIVRTLRYYTVVDVLPIHIQAKLSSRFSSYEPTAIIEQHDKAGLSYIINLVKGKEWLQVRLSSNGKTRVLHRYHNSLLEAEKNSTRLVFIY